jgi:eukaryotic-like serine/threonine-protein kinase
MRIFSRTALPRSAALPLQVFVSGVALVLLVLTLVFVLLSRWVQRNADTVVQRELEQSADLVAQVLSGRQRSLAGGARVFVQGPTFRSFIADRRQQQQQSARFADSLRLDILDQTVEAASQLDADWAFVVGERGLLLAKSDEPDAYGTDLSAVPLVAGALQGHVTSGFGVSRDSLLFQAVAVPIAVPGSAPSGALVATKVVDSLLARDVKAATSAEIVFFVRDAQGARIAATSFATPLKKHLAANVSDQPRSHVFIGDTRYATQGAAVTTAGGEVVGGYVVMSARDAASAELAQVRRALLLGALVGIGLSALAAFVAATRIARPVHALATLAERATLGDYASGATTPLHRTAQPDDLGALDVAVHDLAAELRDRERLASTVGSAATSLARAEAAVAAAPSVAVHRLGVVGGRSASAPARGTTTSAPTSSDELHAGDVVADRYRIEAVLGVGELGVTYRARDRVGGATVALKRMHPARVGSDPAALVAALRGELSAVRRLVHRNVVRLYDVGGEAGVPFVTMEYVEGLSLAALLRDTGPLPDDVVLTIAKQLCRALAAAEAENVVHGRLTPRQIHLGFDGVLRVGDFALAAAERQIREQIAGTGPELASRAPQLAGATVGAPEYMSPEQLIGEAASASADVYAAGVVLYECVTGATPFRTDSPLAFLAQKLGSTETAGADVLQPSRPSRSAVAPLLRDVIARMIAPEADRRPPSAGALLTLIERAG